MLNTSGPVAQGNVYPHEGIALSDEDAAARARIARRHLLKGVAANLLPHRRALQGCGRWLAFGQDGADLCHYSAPARSLRRSRQELGPLKAGRITGLQSCSSPHICPVCAPKIAERRVQYDLAPGLARARALGMGVLVVTSKLCHKMQDDFRAVMTGFVAARGHMNGGSPWARLKKKYGVLGIIRAFECTYGVNGFHPHFHDLYLLERPLTVLEQYEFEQALKVRWMESVVKAGLRDVTREQGLDVSSSHRKIEEYIQKQLHAGTDPADVKRPHWDLPQELAKQPVKAGRASYQDGQKVKGWSLFELLGIVADGVVEPGQPSPARAAHIFREYDAVVTALRIRQLYWSPGLKARLGVQDLTDAQIEALDEKDLHREIWAHLGRAEVQALAADGLVPVVLGALENGTQAEVLGLIAPYVGVRQDTAVTLSPRPRLEDPYADERDKQPVVGRWRDPLAAQVAQDPRKGEYIARSLREMNGRGEWVLHFAEEAERKAAACADITGWRASWAVSSGHLPSAVLLRLLCLIAVEWQSVEIAAWLRELREHEAEKEQQRAMQYGPWVTDNHRDAADYANWLGFALA